MDQLYFLIADKYQCFVQVYTNIWVFVARYTQSTQDNKLKRNGEEAEFLYANIKVFYKLILLLVYTFFDESGQECPKQPKWHKCKFLELTWPVVFK